ASDYDTVILTDDVNKLSSETIFNNGILISKSNFILDGNGFTVNATGTGRIFNITGNNVTLKNITLTGGNTITNGGAILNYGVGTTIVDSKLVYNFASMGGAIYNNNIGTKFSIYGNNNISNNRANSGGAIYNNAADFLINGTNKFEDNEAKTGGAISNYGIRFLINGSNIFDYNRATAGDIYSGGGAIYSIGQYVTISGDNIFTENQALRGGAIYSQGNYFNLTGNNRFLENTATYQGGAIFTRGQHATIEKNNTFIQNQAFSLDDGNGGAIAIYETYNLNITGTNTFYQNTASNGGAIYIDALEMGTSYIMINGTNNFTENHGDSAGGAIYVGGSVNDPTEYIFIKGTNIFKLNRAPTGGVLFTEEGSNYIFINQSNKFYQNSAYVDDGGVIFNNAHYFTISGDNNFTNNTAKENGGIIYNNATGTPFLIEGGNIFSNSFALDGSGGAIYNRADNFTISGNNNFNSNNATLGSGVIYNNGINFLIEKNNTFNNNKAEGNDSDIEVYGGVICNNGANFTIIGENKFNNNLVKSKNAANGGVIYNNGENFTISGDNQFNNNIASKGDFGYSQGGVIFNDGNGTSFLIEGRNIFFNNTAKDGRGGVIYNNNGKYFTIYGNNTFHYNNATSNGGVISNNLADNFNITGKNILNNNYANSGGAIDNFNSNNFIISENNYIINNSAFYDGGGINNFNGHNFTINGTNIIANNTVSKYDGGGICNSLGDNFTIIGHNQIINNNANGSGGGIYNWGILDEIPGGNNFLISGENIISNNNALNENGGGIYNGAGDNFTITGDNQIINNTAAQDGGGIYNTGVLWGLYYGANNFTISDNNVIANNSASRNGGGIYNDQGRDFTINGKNTFFNNSASDKGGAIYNNGTMIVSDAEFINNIALNGTAIYNEDNLTLIKGKFESNSNNYDHFIVNAPGATLFLNGNVMDYSNAHTIEKIYNYGNITSLIYMTYLNNKTVPYYVGQNVILNVTLTDDTDLNVIVGQNVTIQVQHIMIPQKDIESFNNGYYYYYTFIANQTGIHIVNGTRYNGGSNITVKNGILDLGNTTLNITKVVNNDVFYIGDTVIYNITINNAGNFPTYGNITLKDIIPYGLTLTSWNGNGIDWVRIDDDTWTTNSTLVNGSSFVLTLVLTLNSDAKNLNNITNYVTVTANNTNETGDNVTFDINQLILNISKVANVTVANVGDYIHYNITIINTDQLKDVSNVKVIEYCPDGLRYEDYVNTTTGNWFFDGDHTWTLDGNLTAGGTTVLTLVFYVDGSKTGNITNTVNVTTNETPDGENVTSDNTTLTNNNLVIVKDVDVNVANVGDNVTYTITITNDGSDVSDLRIFDYLPAGLNLVSWDAVDKDTKWSFDDDRIWSYLDVLASGETVVLTLVFNVTGDFVGKVNNTVNVTTNETPDGENVTSDNTTLTDVTLGVVKDTNFTSVYIGDVIYYDITVTNLGTTDAHNVTVIEVIPVGLAYDGFDGVGWSKGPGNSWIFAGALGAGNSATLRLYFRVDGNASGFLNNTVIVQSNETGGNESNGTNDTNNDTFVNNVTLDISKIVDKSEANIGDLITYTVIIRNIGSTNATDVVVTEYFPNGLEFISYGDTSLWTRSDNVWTLNSALSAGNIVNLTLVFKVTGNITGNVNNTVNVKSNQTGGNNSTGENSTSNNTTLINVSVVKDVDNPTPNVGNIVTWTITLINNGTEDAIVDMVIDYCPIGLVFVSATSGYEISYYNSTHYKVSWKNILATFNKNTVLSIKTLVNTTENSTNFVVVGNYTPNETNNTDNESVVNITNVTVKKTVNNTNPHRDDVIEYYIDLHNNGPNKAVIVISRDVLPDGLVFLDYITSIGNVTYNSVTREIVWTIDEMPVGSFRLTLIVLVNISNATLTNVVVTTTGSSDPGVNNPSDNVTIIVKPTSNLDLTKVVSVSNPVIGSEFTYTITVINYGPDGANNAFVIDNLPDGVTFVSSSASKGYYDVTTGKWFIGSLANGETVTLIITVVANKIGNFTNFATVYSDSHNPGDNGTNPSDNVTVEIVDVPGPRPTPVPEPKDESKSVDDGIVMEKTGNPIFILLLILISGSIVPLRRRK
ncbi:DUF11 domain-containing protein, partial [Methanobrevibacter sp. OttesenSCG-928-I08]|nr:DUF11 domain-containing protein [Methanobrevibacter sp. OttesenSCG-928-I08]